MGAVGQVLAAEQQQLAVLAEELVVLSGDLPEPGREEEREFRIYPTFYLLYIEYFSGGISDMYIYRFCVKRFIC